MPRQTAREAVAITPRVRPRAFTTRASPQRDSKESRLQGRTRMAINVDKLFVPRRRVITAALLLWVLFAPSRSYSQGTPRGDDRVALELANLGKQGDTIARARTQTLEILQNRNACSAWFQEADPAPREVFRSLHVELETKGPKYIYGIRDKEGQLYFKHPWAAESFEHWGRNSILRLNAYGAFFQSASIVVQQDPEERHLGSQVFVSWWFLPMTATLRRHKSRYCFTN